MSSNGASEGIVSPRHVVTVVAAPPAAASTATISVGVTQEPPESEADGHDSQKKKSAFQITSVVVKSYSEDDNQRQPRSMDDLDDVGTYPSEPGYESFGNGAAPHSPPPPALSGHEHAIAIASLHHPAALLHSSGAAGRNFGGHAQDPKGSRFVVVKVESKDPYTRGRWRCMDFQDESERGDISVVKSADSSGSSRASSVNYTHGVDDPQKNPLLLLHSVPEVVAAKLSAAEQQQQSQQFVPPAVAALPAGVDGVLLVQHAANSAASAPDVMLKTGFTNYVANAGANPSVSAAVAAAASQAHGLSAVSHSGLSTGVGQPKPATASSVPAVAASAGASASLFSSSMPSVAAARTAVDSIAGMGPGVAASAPHDVYQSSVSTSAASIAAASAVSATAVEPEAVAADGSRPSPGLQAGGLPHPVQQLVQPKNAIVIVKPEPLRTVPAAPAPLAMTLGETLGLQVRDEPSANDAQIRETDASTTGVAIDNKIEQAMDLVKSHLMFAVREEVEDLRQQIKELIDEKTRLEYENNVLRAALSPEMLSKLLPPPQPAQPTQTQQSALLKAAAAVQPQGSL